MLFLCNQAKSDLKEGEIPDFFQAYTVRGFLDITDETFEKKHNFIAFTVPTDEQSDHCPQAPLLTKPEVRVIMQNAVLMRRCRAVVSRTLRHFGIVYNEYDVQFEVVKGMTLHRLEHGDHNQKRMSRVLRFLRIFNPEHAVALLQFVGSKICTSKRARELEAKGELPEDMIVVSQYTFQMWHAKVFKPSFLSF